MYCDIITHINSRNGGFFMEIRYFREYSNHLHRFMEHKIIGTDGIMCYVFPCQNGRYFEWEDRGMFDLVNILIEQGHIQFCTVDSIDVETISAHGHDADRFLRHEQWVSYIMEELIPSSLRNAKLPLDSKCMTTGCSLGAYHALNLFLRFPDRFNKVLGMSGLYDIELYFGTLQNEITYLNNPVMYLANMPMDHPYIKKYNKGQIILSVGQGSYEDLCKETLRRVSTIFKEKGIDAWCDFWGYDVHHDWCWWQLMLQYFLPQMV